MYRHLCNKRELVQMFVVHTCLFRLGLNLNLYLRAFSAFLIIGALLSWHVLEREIFPPFLKIPPDMLILIPVPKTSPYTLLFSPFFKISTNTLMLPPVPKLRRYTLILPPVLLIY